MSKKSTTNKITTKQISFYFDSEEKYRRDRSIHQNRCEQWSLIRSKLQKIRDEDFNASMSAIEAIIDYAIKDNKEEDKFSRNVKSRAASTLFENSQGNKNN